MDMAADLNCPLCLDLPTGPVHQCNNGHIFCGDCLTIHRASGTPASQKCPTCRCTLSGEPIRNRIAEAAISRLPGPCEGCGERMPRKDLSSHMATCSEVQVQCPVPTCSTRVRRRDLAAHMASATEAHLTIAQSLAADLEAKNEVLASLTVQGKIRVKSLSRPSYTSVTLKRMVAISEQESAFAAAFTRVNRADYRIEVDETKSPHELGLRDGFTLEATDQTLNIKAVNEQGEEMFFKLRRTTQLDKVMRAYCNRHRVPITNLRFLFDGVRLSGSETPIALEMEDGDVVVVVPASA
jgi:hypothetical protein